MLKKIKCPVCQNVGLFIELDENSVAITSGKPLKEFNCITVCSVCKRKIKYDVRNLTHNSNQ